MGNSNLTYYPKWLHYVHPVFPILIVFVFIPSKVMDNLAALFTKESSFEKHFAAQEKGCPKYVATLLVLQRIGTDVLQSKNILHVKYYWLLSMDYQFY